MEQVANMTPKLSFKDNRIAALKVSIDQLNETLKTIALSTQKDAGGGCHRQRRNKPMHSAHIKEKIVAISDRDIKTWPPYLTDKEAMRREIKNGN
eukprot:15275088-Ditylum_brightwellii.AAC.1